MNRIVWAFQLAAILLAGLIFSGCAWLIGFPKLESKDIPAIFDKLGTDQASACMWVGGRGGGGALTVTPAPVLPGGGGYGSGELLFGRVNSDNTKLTIANGSCSIERGGPTLPMQLGPGIGATQP